MKGLIFSKNWKWFWQCVYRGAHQNSSLPWKIVPKNKFEWKHESFWCFEVSFFYKSIAFGNGQIHSMFFIQNGVCHVKIRLFVKRHRKTMNRHVVFRCVWIGLRSLWQIAFWMKNTEWIGIICRGWFWWISAKSLLEVDNQLQIEWFCDHVFFANSFFLMFSSCICEWICCLLVMRISQTSILEVCVHFEWRTSNGMDRFDEFMMANA